MSRIHDNIATVASEAERLDMDDVEVDALRKIIDERYQMSFDRSRLTTASDLHREAKRLLGIGTDYA